MLLVIFILPFYSFEEYSIIRNTTSQLGAHAAPNGWVMNLTFVLLGVTSIISGWKYLGRYWFHCHREKIYRVLNADPKNTKLSDE
ncbi:MAG: DUF998 domain-containing protein [candidate division WOR-3 bacterium]|nr:MAG: DUF998 domain-containing protein [candidate division WOR-3 bacterium]